MISPIICLGDELAAVCADIRARGGFVASLETGVGGKNSNYRVSYFLGRSAPIVGESSEVPGCKPSGVTIAANTTNEKHCNPSAVPPAKEAACLMAAVAEDGPSIERAAEV